MTENQESSVLAVSDLTVYRGKAKILDDIQLTLKKGETLALVGESGAGKSTIVMALMGLLNGAKVEGKVNMAEVGDLFSLSERQKVRLRGRKLSMIFQDAGAALNPAYTVGRQMMTVLRRNLGLTRMEARKQAIDLFTSVGINDAEARLKAYPHQLSGGMQQRVMVAIALACNPELLFADEPTSALDVTIQAQIIRLILTQIHAKGASCIFVLHDLALASQACDKIIVLYAGQIVEAGPAHAVLEHYRHPYTRQLKSCVLEIGKMNLVAPEGTVPSHDHMPIGCRFSTRCPRALPKCAMQRPELQATKTENHVFACWNPENERNNNA